VEWSRGKGEEGDGRPYVHTGCSTWTNAISRWASDSTTKGSNVYNAKRVDERVSELAS
jgi:hypothetical protein